MMTGAVLIGGSETLSSVTLKSIAPAPGDGSTTAFLKANASHVDRARALADAIVAIGDDLIVPAMAETGLPRARLKGEHSRGRARSAAGAQGGPHLRQWLADRRRGEPCDGVWPVPGDNPWRLTRRFDGWLETAAA